MLRTRSAILDAAARCVAERGVRRTTMGDIAATGGVAKATLYNHFRTKDDVLAALVEARVAALAAECEAVAAATGVADALAHAAAELAASPPLRHVATHEPALLAPLAVPDETRAWGQVRSAVAGVLAAGGGTGGAAEVEAVLRWLLSQLLWPAAAGEASAGARVLAGGLGASSSPCVGIVPEQACDVAGLGWPG